MASPIKVLQQQTIGAMSGDWDQTVPFNQFDPSTGDLLDAIFTTAGTIDVGASIENLAPVTANVNFSVAATIVATAPDIGNVGSVVAFAGGSVNLGALPGPFDGTLNFGGPSGTVVPDISASATQYSVVYPGTATASPLEGTGTFDVAVSSYATSTVNGNGNLAVLLHSTASAVVSLEYDATAQGAGDSSGSVTNGFNVVGVIGFIGNLVTSTPQVVVLPSQTTGWTSAASFSQFNPALGSLEEITLNVGNTVAGTFAVENLENVPAPVTMTETAGMSVSTPGLANAITAAAGAYDNLSLGANDGSADFAGSSGQSDTIDGPLISGWNPISGQYQPLSPSTSSITLLDGTDLSAFTGTGTIALPVTTAGTSTVTGPSNLLSEITQHTGGTVTVSFVYSTPLVTSETAAKGLGGASTISSPFGTVASSALSPPKLMFVGGWGGAASTEAHTGETFRIGSGASETIDDFSLTAGEKLDLTSLLNGAPLTSDLSNLGAYVSVTGYATDSNGGTDSTLAIRGPEGSASVTLVNAKPIAVVDLLNDNALVLPAH